MDSITVALETGDGPAITQELATNLYAVFATVPDQRARHGRSDELAMVLHFFGMRLAMRNRAQRETSTGDEVVAQLHHLACDGKELRGTYRYGMGRRAVPCSASMMSPPVR